MSYVSAALPAVELPDNERRRLMRTVSKARSRLHRRAAMEAAVRVLLVVFWLLPLLVLADRLFALSAAGWKPFIVFGGALVLTFPYVLLCAFSPKLNAHAAAAVLDENLCLKSRLSTALALETACAGEEKDFVRTPADRSFAAAFYEETAERLPSVSVERAVPVRLPRGGAFLLPPLALAAGLWFWLPQYDLLGLLAVKQDEARRQQVQKRAAKRLERKLIDLKKKTARDQRGDGRGKSLKGLTRQVEKLVKEMKGGGRELRESLTKLGKLRRKINAARKRLAAGKGFKERLAKLARKKSGDGSSPKDRSPTGVTAAMREGDMKKAARRLRALRRELRRAARSGSKKNAAKAAERLKQLREELERLAEQAKSDPALHKKLDELAKKFGDKDYEKLVSGKAGGRSDKETEKLAHKLDELADSMDRLAESDEALLDDKDREKLQQMDEMEAAVVESMDDLLQGERKGGKRGGKKGRKLRLVKGGKSGKGGKGGKGGNKGLRLILPRGGKDGSGGKKGGSATGMSPGGNKGGTPNGRSGDGMGGGKGYGQRPESDTGKTKLDEHLVHGRMQSGVIEGLSYFRGRGAKGQPPKEVVEGVLQGEQEQAGAIDLERIPADARKLVKEYFSELRQAARLPKAQKKPTPTGE